LAAAALEAARHSARRRNGAARAAARRSIAGSSQPYGAGREPQLFGSLVRRLVADRGWTETAVSAGVLSRWDQIVGPDIADHAAPQSLRDGELVLVAESTAWATQLRLLVPSIQARIAAEVGAGVVKRIRVHGPAAPSWRKGPRRVMGRGPRDTYG